MEMPFFQVKSPVTWPIFPPLRLRLAQLRPGDRPHDLGEGESWTTSLHGQEGMPQKKLISWDIYIYNIYILYIYILYIHVFEYIWINYNGLTSRPKPGMMVRICGIIPKWPQDHDSCCSARVCFVLRKGVTT